MSKGKDSLERLRQNKQDFFRSFRADDGFHQLQVSTCDRKRQTRLWHTRTHGSHKRSNLCDFLRHVVRPVNQLAGSDDVHVPRRQGDEWVGFEIHEVESDLRDLGDGSVAHQVRVRCGVQDVGLAVPYATERTEEEEVKPPRDDESAVTCFSPALPGRTLALRFFRSQSGLMASISSTEEARRMLWKLSRERLCDREQFEPEASWLRLRRWCGATHGDDWVSGPTR